MNRKPFFFLLVLYMFSGVLVSAQNNEEREHRIKKSQFPAEALLVIETNNNDFKRIKYYKAVDSISKTYTAKFKKARLYYEMDFSENGDLSALGFAVKQVDIPEESYSQIANYLSQNFEKTKVRKMLQFYPIQSKENLEETVKNAFQNLMLPDMVYELFVKGRKNGASHDFELTFDAEGNLVQKRKALPANYDRVLY